MSDNDSTDSSNTSKIDSTINAVTNLVKEVPIYQDAVQPIAKETGKALGTLGRTVNVCLAPIRGLVWGAERIEDFVNSKVTEKLKDVPEEEIITPDPHIAGPLLESLRFTGNNSELKEMYANLLASSMNRNESSLAHPSFVEIIKNLTSDEAKIINYLYYKNKSIPIVDIYARYKDKNKGEILIHKNLSQIEFDLNCDNFNYSYYDNLLRLKIINIPEGRYLKPITVYDSLLKHKIVKDKIDEINLLDEFTCEIKKRYITLSDYGLQFAEICCNDDNPSPC